MKNQKNMIKVYKFDYDHGEASISIKVDTARFSQESAKTLLDFYSWTYTDDDEDLIEILLIQYSIIAIKSALYNQYNVAGIIHEFGRTGGLCSLDGSIGLELIDIDPISIYENRFNLKIE